MKNLIVQTNTPSQKVITKLADIIQADQIDSVTKTAFRLTNITEHPAIYSFCEEHQLDWAIVDSDRYLSDFDVLATDMDSTLITIECIDEIADLCGLKKQVSIITESAMRGEIDFTESLTRRVGLLAGLEETALNTVYQERLTYSPGAETLIHAVSQAGLKTMLLSGGFTFFTERIMNDLGMDTQCANLLEIVNGKLTGRVLGDIVDAQKKADTLLQFCRAQNTTPDRAIAVGDGANDLVMMHHAGVSIAYRAKPKVASKATHAINYVGLEGILPLFS